jgi:hypothetical protein
MPVQGSITLNSKVYTPRGTESGTAKWALVGDTSFGGANSVLTEKVSGPSKDGIWRIRSTFNVPKAAEDDSTCACIGQILGEAAADIQIRVPNTFTLAERQDFVDRLQAWVATSVFDSSVSALEGSWG